MTTREQKTYDQKQRLENQRLERKRRLERVLSALGLLKGFRDLPGRVHEAAIRTLPGRPMVVIGPSAQASPIIAQLKTGVEYYLGLQRIEAGDGNAILLGDFLSVCTVLPSGFSSGICRRLPAKYLAFVKHAEKVSAAFLNEHLTPAVTQLGSATALVLMTCSRMDGEVFGIGITNSFVPGKPVCELTIQRSKPRIVNVVIDGHARPAFRCAMPNLLEGIKWIDCDGAVFDLDAGRRYPVFLQSHALLRLRDRLAANSETEMALNIGLWSSLNSPVVVERQEGSYFIEFRFGGDRVGYLVARVVDDKIVIVTFLLLTMQGTPESRMLRQKLGFSRHDIEFGRLDRLETFLSPDVAGDEELVRVLGECGCGPLLKLAQNGFPHEAINGQAEELKRFLGITGGAGPNVIKGFTSRCSWRG